MEDGWVVGLLGLHPHFLKRKEVDVMLDAVVDCLLEFDAVWTIV